MASSLTPAFGSIVPSQKLQALETNYLSFTDGTNDFAQQYLPEIYEQEVERYGNRTLSGFLRMVGAEMPMTSDQVVWSEQNRLHIAYDNVIMAAGNPINVLSFNVTATITNVIGVNDTIVVMDPTNGTECTAVVTAKTAGVVGGADATITVAPYAAAALSAAANAGGLGAGARTDLKIFVYGSEYGKGLGDASAESITPSFTQFSNSPIIIKSKYQISGSDTAQIGWVEVATEDGTSGYLWYLKAESETRLRFEDYLEMSVVEGELAVAGSAAIATKKGTDGLFSAIKSRGNVQNEFGGTLAEFDKILKNLDTQGAIEENMLFVNRGLSLELDDMLAGLSAGANGGTAYGLFENSEDMALNLGFTGFRRGSYDFYKTDWKYLNDASTRGGLVAAGGAATINPIEGVLVPAGTSTVYDQTLGTNIRRPFLHVRYRASQADDRRMKSWLTGSVGGAYTSDLDAMQVHFLSERCLCVQGANNFVIFTGA
jgi:hypothetical protein|tara:strand:+ start:831 stop:2288 length:1458 start_codon:yes stop_codon:yes gene_type:complete